MILRGDRCQWHREILDINSEEHIYIHPGSPDLDSETLGTGAHNHIILKQWSWWGSTSDARLERIVLHYLGGGQEDLLNLEADALEGQGTSSYRSYSVKLHTDINLLRAIEFQVSNIDTENQDRCLMLIVYELVK